MATQKGRMIKTLDRLSMKKRGGWMKVKYKGETSFFVEEHIPCHKGAYTGRNGITRDRLERPAGTQGIKEGGG